MRLDAAHVARSALAILAGVVIVSCSDMPSRPSTAPRSAGVASLDGADAPKIVISQIYGGGGNSGATYKNDFIELYNPGTTAVSLSGWSVQYTSAAGTTWSNRTNLTGTIAAGGYYVVREGAGAGGSLAVPANDSGGIAMSATAGKVALVNSTTALVGACPLTDATVVDFVGFGTGTSGANCFEGSAAAPTLSNTNAGFRKNNGAQDTNNNSADFVTGAPNPRVGTGGGGTPTVSGKVSIGAGTSPLVIGYQTQMFVTSGSTDNSGKPVTSADVTWSTSNPNILTIDARGVVTAAAEGSATLTGTAADGTAGSFTLSTEVPFYSSSARTGHNTEFGVPADHDASDDVIIARKQYTVSYNPKLGGPNWVSWDLSATHLGTRNRCNCYSADTALVRLGYGQYMYNTADYTNGGYDRGHMEPSADQTTTDGENATTFFLTNFLPQQHGLNAGPWERLEIALRDSVNAGREAYVIAGGVFTNGIGLGSLKNEGKIFIPDSTWKIVVLMPANTGLDDVTSATDVNVIAVNMPNVDNPGTNDWTKFTTTVDKIQRSTGYDFLASLPDAIECKVEGRNCTPVVSAFAGATLLRGETYAATVSFTDPDVNVWTATVDYGDGTAVQPVAVLGQSFHLEHVYASNGTFTVTVRVSDGAATATRTATVVVKSPAQGIADLAAMITTLDVNDGQANSLQMKLRAAGSHTAAGRAAPAQNVLSALLNELRALVSAGRIPAEAAAPIIDYAQRVIESIDTP